MTELAVNIISYSDTELVVSQVAPIDIGSNKLHLQLRSSAADYTVFMEATTDDMITVVASTDTETITLTVPNAKLVKLPPGDYVHSLVLSENAGTKRTGIWRGTWTHNAGPTRWPQGQV